MISSLIRCSCSNIFCATCIMFGLLGALHAQQTGEKLASAKDDLAQINDAVLISNVAVAGKEVECGLFIKPTVVQPVTPFQAGSDWLQQMTISLVNRTNKTIVFGNIHLHFLDTGDCRSVPCVGAELTLGQMPAIDAYEGRTGRPLRPEHPERAALDWGPEQTIAVHVSDYMGEIERRLADFMPETDVTKVKVYRGVFFFADGMRFTLGRYSVPDPDHPGKFKELPADYFPGRRGNNWPPGYKVRDVAVMYANCGSPTNSCPSVTQYTGCTAGDNPWMQAVTDSDCCSPSGIACNAGARCNGLICLSNNTCGSCRAIMRRANSDCCNGNCSSGTAGNRFLMRLPSICQTANGPAPSMVFLDLGEAVSK